MHWHHIIRCVYHIEVGLITPMIHQDWLYALTSHHKVRISHWSGLPQWYIKIDPESHAKDFQKEHFEGIVATATSTATTTTTATTTPHNSKPLDENTFKWSTSPQQRQSETAVRLRFRSAICRPWIINSDETKRPLTGVPFHCSMIHSGGRFIVVCCVMCQALVGGEITWLYF